MTRARRQRAAHGDGISEVEWAFITDTMTPEIETAANPFDLIELRTDRDDGSPAHLLWKQHRLAVLSEWIDAYPGTRPSLWWDFDAPRQPVGTHPGCIWDGKLSEPRLRVGGIGTPRHDALGYVPRFRCGMPSTGWLTPWDVEYFSGRAVDLHGNPIGTRRTEGDPFLGDAFDPADPPTFESQAAYLGRFGLMLRAEMQRLPKTAFTPESAELPDDPKGHER